MLLGGNAFPEIKLVALLSLAVGLNLLCVLLQIDGETGVSGCIANKIKVIGSSRMHGGADGGGSGVADGAGGQAGMPISVVGRRRLKVGGVDGAAPVVVEHCG